MAKTIARTDSPAAVARLGRAAQAILDTIDTAPASLPGRSHALVAELTAAIGPACKGIELEPGLWG